MGREESGLGTVTPRGAPRDMHRSCPTEPQPPGMVQDGGGGVGGEHTEG